MKTTNRTDVTFRPYEKSDCEACLTIFDANCPEFFGPNEREDYEQFLDELSDGYEVCEVEGKVSGAFGLLGDKEEKRLCWILISPELQNAGVGSKMMEHLLRQGRATRTRTIGIAASQISAPFFARFGAKNIATTPDGFAPGLDRVDMILLLEQEDDDLA